MAASTRHGRQPTPPTSAPRRPQPPLPRHTTVRRRRPQRRRLPWPARLLLVALVLGLGGTIVLGGSGALDGLNARLGTALSGLVSGVIGAGASPTAAPTPVALVAPTLEQPTDRYTNTGTLDVVGHLPGGVAGRSGMSIRIYVNGDPVEEIPVARTTDFVVRDLPLPRSWSEITATLVARDGDESPPSKAIHVSFDDLAPPLEITAPADASEMNGETVTVRGVTQGGSTITVRNATTRDQTQGQATTEGDFEVAVPVEKGSNPLTVTARDPAGNEASAAVSVVRGDGELTAKLKLSASRIQLASLPQPITITVTVLDPDGKPVNDAHATFTLSPPGLPTETFDAVTVNGEAVWPDVTIPRDGATEGGGFATVSVELPDGKVVEETAAFSLY